MSKLLTVFGATGVQGGSVINAVLAHPRFSSEYKLRAITRDTSKPNAKALRAKGVETVMADAEDSGSLKEALAGSYAVFAVTNYWEKKSMEGEIRQGKNIANAAKEVGVKHLVWSGLPHVTKLTNGALKDVQHFDSKAEVSEYIDTMKGEMVSTVFMPGFYMQNIKGMIRAGQDGVPTLMQPWDANETQVGLLDAAVDTGKFVVGVLAQDPKTVNGLRVQAVSEWVTPTQITDTITKVTGTKVKFQSVAESVYQGFLPEPIAKEMTENMVLVRDYSYYGKGTEKEQGKYDVLLGQQEKTSWEDFVKQNGPWEW